MIMTKSQEAYFHHVTPEAFNCGHFALLEDRNVGETRIEQDGKELGHLVLGGTKDCTIIMWGEPIGRFKIFAFIIDT